MINIFKKQKDNDLKARITLLEDNVSELSNELKVLKQSIEQIHDTIFILTAAQYQIGNDVGMIYKTLKSLTAASLDDDIFSLNKDDDDKGYLN